MSSRTSLNANGQRANVNAFDFPDDPQMGPQGIDDYPADQYPEDPSNGNDQYDPNDPSNAPTAPKKKIKKPVNVKNILKYVGIGVAVILVGVFAYVIYRNFKKKKDAEKKKQEEENKKNEALESPISDADEDQVSAPEKMPSNIKDVESKIIAKQRVKETGKDTTNFLANLKQDASTAQNFKLQAKEQKALVEANKAAIASQSQPSQASAVSQSLSSTTSNKDDPLFVPLNGNKS
jgi:hypothetical protein